MFVRVTELYYWKSEHTRSTCQDAFASAPERGLFAVADGVASASFSEVWSRILVHRFLDSPLLSTDPFEVEWWLRAAQEAYLLQAPDPATMPFPQAREKARQGSASTLVTMRITEVEDGLAAAQVLAIGDSCLFVLRPGEVDIQAFPLSSPEEFDRSPICLPTRLFDRSFHRCLEQQQTLAAGDVVVLATDGVARWIAGSGGGSLPSPRAALEAVVACPPESWSAFVDDQRRRDLMVDDDSTALIVALSHKGEAPEMTVLGSTNMADDATRQARAEAYAAALAAGDRVQAAVLAGDPAVSGVDPARADINLLRRVADAHADLFRAMRANLRTLRNVQPLWEQYAELLAEEPVAAPLRASLEREGVILRRGADAPAQGFLPKGTTLPATAMVVPVAAHTARTDVAALDAIRDAISAHDDEAIVAAAGDAGTAIATLQPEERDRIEQARQRIAQRDRFRAALGSGDARMIVAAFDPVLDEPGVLSGAEDAELRRARIAQAMPDQVRRAIAEGDDQVIVSVFRSDLIQDWMAFTDAEKERINLALQRIGDRNRFRQAIEADDDLAIAAAWHADMEGWFRPSPPEHNRIGLALLRREALQRLRGAFDSNSDEHIAAEYDPILDGSANLTAEDRARLDLARQRVEALKRLRTAVATQDEERIARSYDSILHGSLDLDDELRRRAAEAVLHTQALDRLVKALDADDDAAIVAASNSRHVLPWQLHADQCERVALAYERMRDLWRLRQAIQKKDQGMVRKLTRDRRIMALLSEQERLFLESPRGRPVGNS